MIFSYMIFSYMIHFLLFIIIMAPKRKNQRTISAMFAWKPPNDTNDININNDLNEDMDLFGTNLEILTQESCSSKLTK